MNRKAQTGINGLMRHRQREESSTGASAMTNGWNAMSQSCRALTALALALPGLALSPSSANAGYTVETSGVAARDVSALGYVPTGASRLSGILASNAASVKRYRITCFDDGMGQPVQARVRIRGKTAAAKFNIKATLESNGERQEVIDTKNGDVVFSSYAPVRQGTSEYILTIAKVKKKPGDNDKKLKGAMVFETRQECDTATGAYTGINKPTPIP